MSKIVVADTGPLIALALLRLLPVLPKLFSTVYVPEAVILEATQDPAKPGAIEIQNALDNGLLLSRKVTISQLYKELIVLLDQGEVEALAMASELSAVALIDERRGRKVAAKQGIAVTGTAAILIKAKKCGEITLVKPYIIQLCEQGYRLSPKLIQNVLQICEES